MINDGMEQHRQVRRTRGFVVLGYCVIFTLGLAYMAMVPSMTGSLSFYFYLMLWAVMASGINIMAGFTGYIAFGYVAFYGIGAYTTSILVARLDINIYLALVGAFVVGVLGSLAFSKILSLRGIYFAMVSLAIAVICRSAIASAPSDIAGGAFGITMTGVLDPTAAYLTMVALCGLVVAVSFWIKLSRFGMHLAAIRDDQEAAQVAGLNVKWLRLQAWMISAGFGAAAGGVEAWFTTVIDPESAFNLLVSTKSIIYAAFGGFGTVTGPVIGAFVMYTVDSAIWERYPALNNLALGVAIVLLMVFLPRGIVGTITHRWPKVRKWLF